MLFCAHVDAESCSIYENVAHAVCATGRANPCDSKIHTSSSGQSATLLSPEPEPHPNQSKQKPFNSQESRETRKLSECHCFCWNHLPYFTEGFHLDNLSEKSSYFFIINWKINLTEPKSQKIVYDSYYQFTHSLLWFFSIFRVPCRKSKKVLTVNYLQTWHFTGITE